MSRILHLVNMGLRYGRSKGVQAHRQEEPPLGSLAAPCHLEENASHQMAYIPSERALKIMGMHVENDPYHEL